ncbi:MAG: dTDP-4-dehydrorhamnose reductase [Acidobacteriota bacterium]
MTNRWLITGAAGMVGRDLVKALSSRHESVVAVDRTQLDITDATAVLDAVNDAKPTIIVNCAAYTKVDQAESEEYLATAINGSAVEFLAEAANRVEALLVQLSTDFVFDGVKREPYEVNDHTAPVSAYGRSKLVGERSATHARQYLVVRTAWLFGVNGPNFVEAIRNQIRQGSNPLRVVDDQRGRPTYTPHLANALVRLGRMAQASDTARGIVHYADESECTWYDFTRAIMEELGTATAVTPVTSSEFVRPAKRPGYSVLSTERYESLTGVKPEPWRDGLREYFEQRP